MPVAIQKMCSVCGKDVSAVKRHKNAQGQYFCEPCVGALRAGQPGGRPVPQPSGSPVPPARPTAETTPVLAASQGRGGAATVVTAVWGNRYGRIGMIAAVVITAVAVPLVVMAKRDYDKKIEDMRTSADNAPSIYDKLAASEARQAAAAQREAATLHADADRVRGTEGTAGSTSAAQSKDDAIQADPFISGLVDQYPDVKDRIKAGGQMLDLKLTQMAASGLLTPADVKRVNDFSNNIQALP